MARNVCPRCKEVIMGLGDEPDIKCAKCKTVFGVSCKTDDNASEDVDD